MEVQNLYEENNVLTFTLSGVNVSIANSIRRIILSEIPCVVFQTTPYEQNKVNIEKNTTRMNNELIKQRLSCIPIFINDLDTPIENYQIKINKKNTSDNIEFITTEDIDIIDKNINKSLDINLIRNIFPKNSFTNDFIDIVRLRPSLSKESEGEQLILTADLSIGTAKENGAYNVVSTCSYGNTPNIPIIEEKISKLILEYENKNLDQKQIDFLIKDWRLLNEEMHFIPDSFDFTIETIGQFSNKELIIKAIDIMKQKILKFIEDIQVNEDLIKKSETTLENAYDIFLIKEDYTLGKAIEYMLFKKHYDKDSDKILNFVGFKKPHPHVDESLIRLGFYQATDKSSVIIILINVGKDLDNLYQDILNNFNV